MGSCGIAGPLSIKMLAPSMNANRSKLGSLETFIGTNKAYTLTKSVQFPCLVLSQKNVKFLSVACGASSQSASSVAESLKEEKAVSLTNNYLPTSLEVETLLTEICDTSIVELELKLGGFRLYAKRNIEDKIEHVAASDPPAIVANQITEELDTNGSVSSTSLAISKPNPSAITVQSLHDSASDEGLAILQSPKVGFFRRSKTIKGKRAPPSCKENQIVKEGQVLCFIEQLGGEIPIESDVSGEIIKILRKDGEPVGYGDALIAVLPSFPGIKKLQ